ncbi:MBL fold metallo-hydrolase [Thalassolituus sp. LLYu03]|uniref:MBL fold metallo-hydrolase n=1 Tax=Thalassolituus sp. LLYu03 TaxID=3421656 RepID=UPI003D2E9357
MKWSLVASGLVGVLFLLVAVPLLLSACASGRVKQQQADVFARSPQYKAEEQKFANPVPTPEQGVSEIVGIMWDMATAKDPRSVPDVEIPVQALTTEQLLAQKPGEHRVYRIGHSTLLLALNGEFWLLDPVFSERASPVQWAGPKRFHQPPLSLEALPHLTGVIISHDHYDHLDEHSIRILADKADGFYVPLGVGRYLREWGVEAGLITEHDWWQETRVGDTLLAATPAQHFSGRGAFDRDATLWASWVIIRDGKRYFFSGDGGYFDGFKDIGMRYGPFDLTMIENGAYNPRWSHIHMHPQESVQAHIDLKGKHMLPIHNSTFDLSMHAWFDPLEQVRELAHEREVSLITPRIGESVLIGAEQRFSYWWQSLMPASEGTGGELVSDRL